MIEELVQKREEIEQQLEDVSDKLSYWQAKLAEAEAELTDAVLGGEATYERTIARQEAQFAVTTLKQRRAELKQELRQAEREVLEARYEQGKREILKVQSEAHERLGDIEDELIEVATRCWQESWRAQSDANKATGEFNGQVANRAGAPTLSFITRMNGLDVFEYCTGVLRAATIEGDLS